MDAAQVRDEAVRETVREEIKRANVASQAYGTVTAVSGNTATVTMDGSSDNVPCTALVPCKAGDRVVVTVIKRQPMVTGVVGASWLPLDGGALTGPLTMEAAGILLDSGNITSGTRPSAETAGDAFARFRDSGNAIIGQVGPRYFVDGSQCVELFVQRLVNGSPVYNIIRLIIAEDGTRSYWIQEPAAFRSAISAAASSHNHAAGDITSGTLGAARGGTGVSSPTAGSYLVGNGSSAVALKTPAQVLADIGALPLAGGTITGTLNRKNADMDTSAASLSAAKYSVIGFTDANDRYVAFLQALETTDGTSGFDVAVRRYNGGANKTNHVRLKMDKSSNASVEFSHPAAWRDGLGLAPVVLFESATAVNEPTLSDSVANYARIRVHVKDNHGVFCGSHEFYGLAAGSVFTVSQEEATANDTTTVRRSRFAVSSDGTTLTPSYGGYYNISHASKTITSASTNGTNYLRIYRVEGFAF
jgi:hypothetical protein